MNNPQAIIRTALLFAYSADYDKRRENIKKMLSTFDFAMAEFLGAVLRPLDKGLANQLVCEFLVNVNSRAIS